MKTKYYNLLAKHGAVTLLTVLERLEEQERYEECQQLSDALTEYKTNTGAKFPGYLTDDYIQHVAQFNNKSVKYVTDQSNYNANLILKEIETWT